MKAPNNRPPRKPVPFCSGGVVAAVWQAAGQVFYQCGPGGQTIHFEGAWKQVLGLDCGVLKGGRAEWRKRVDPGDAAEVAAMDAMAAEGRSQTLEYRYVRAGGDVIWLRDTQCLARDPATGGPVLAGSLADISATRQMAARLRHYQTMRVFGELAGGVAHDFNNILALFHGYTELLQMGVAPGSPEEEYLAEMMGAVERARGLTSQLHQFSHFKPESPTVTNLVSAVRECRRVLRRLTQEHIELVLNEKTEAAWIKADPLELESLILNLAVNACEAMPRGGRLELEVARVKGQCRLAVKDTGEGVSEADGQRIFEPGYTTRKRQGAEGMGLAVCRQAAERHGGRITFRSKPGKGSEFRVEFPAQASPFQNSEAAVEKFCGGQGEEILVVEDDHSVRKTLAQTVMRLGYRVHCASNGEGAKRLLEKETKIRLVISDLVMPLMDGGELAEMIQSRWPGMPVILTSGYGSFPPPEKPNDVPHRLFLPKPLAVNSLARHIRQLIDV